MRAFADRLVIVVALLAAGPARAADPPAAPAGRITYVDYEPDYLNPYLRTDPATGVLERLTSRGLTDRDADGHWIPLLADKVPDPKDGDVSTDLLTVTWKLRPGLLWSDGAKLTSDDLRFTWEVCHDPGQGCARTQGFIDIDRVDTPDPQTIVLHYAKPFFDYQGQFRPGVLPRHSGDVAQAGQVAQWSWNRTLVPTTGPFELLRWDPGNSLTLVPNPHFYLPGKPLLARIKVGFKGDPEAMVNAVLAGEADISPWLPMPGEARIEQARARGLVLGDGVTPYLNEIQFNLRNPRDLSRPHPILGDARVRKALLTGIDVDAVLANWTIPGVYTMRRMTSPSDLAPGFACRMPPIAADAEAAKRMLHEAGWEPGFGGIREKSGRRLQLRISAYTAPGIDFEPNLQVLRAQLRALGVATEVVRMDAQVMFGSWVDGSPLATGDFDIAFYDAPRDLPGLQEEFETYFGSAGVPDAENPDGRNTGGIMDGQIDGWLKQARGTLDAEARRALYCKVADRVQNDLSAQEYTATWPNFPVSQPRLVGWRQEERMTWFGQGAEDWSVRK